MQPHPDGVPPAQAPAGEPAPPEVLVQQVAAEQRAEPERLLLHMPVDVRSASMAILAVIAVVWTLHWAKAVFVPLMLSLLLTYALTPAVDWLARWRIPRWLGAALMLLAMGGAMGGTGWALADDASELFETLPVAAQKVRLALQNRVSTGNPLDTVQKAAAQLEQAAEESARAATPRGATRVVIQRQAFNVRDYLWSSTGSLVSALGQLVLVVFLTFFALASGDTFRRKMVKITGPSLSKKRVTVQVLDDITAQIQRYLLVQLLVSVIVGVLTWTAFGLLGLENAAVWGIAAGVLNLIPYIGSVAVTSAAVLVAFLQFGTIEMALAVGAASLVVRTITGNLIAPWLASRTVRMNPVAVFVGVLAWGWLWGVWGLLLGIPVLMIVKAVCDRVEDLKPIGELLGV